MGFAASSANWLFELGDMRAVVAAGVVATILSLLLFPRKTPQKVIPVKAEGLPIRTVAANPGVLIPTLTLLAVNICFGSTMTFLPLFMLSQGIKEISLFYVGYSIAVIFSRFWVGRLCDWLAPERLSLFILLVLGGTMLVVGEFVSEWVLVLSGASIGIGYGLAFPSMATIVTANTLPANRGAAFGFFTMSVDAGFAIGAIGMGVVAAKWGLPNHFYGYWCLYFIICRFLSLVAFGKVSGGWEIVESRIYINKEASWISSWLLCHLKI
jgi:predicted MFS family arabinose efflux permease